MSKKTSEMRKDGFTLIELMIVIAIIGILAAIAIPQFSSYRIRSHNSLALSDLRNAGSSQEAYYTDNERYTVNEGSLIGSHVSAGVDLDIMGASNAGYTMRAYHSNGDKTYTLTKPGGAITSN